MHRRDTASPTSASSSARSKLFLDMDSLKRTPATSIGTNPTHWSQASCDLVPPKSAALTFAAVWDDDRGIMTFTSSKGLFEQRQSDYIMVEEDDNDDDFFDDDEEDYEEFRYQQQDGSDVETFGENESTMAIFQDAFKAFLHRTPRGPRFSACASTQAQPSSSVLSQPVAGPSTFSKEHANIACGAASGSRTWPRRGPVRRSKSKGTLASSTLDGLNVYDKADQQQQQPSRAQRFVSTHYSCFDTLDREPAFRPSVTFRRRNPAHANADSVSDEGFFESSECVVRAPALQEREYLKSHFSTTTTSTSNYIDVARFSTSDSYFSSPLSISPYTGTPPNSPRKRLRKRSPTTTTTTTATTPTTPPPGQHASRGPHGHSPLASSSTTSSDCDSPGPATPVDAPLSASTSSTDKRASPLQYVRRMCSTLTGGPGAGDPNHGWVCVEVTPVITQRVVETA